MEDAVVRIAEMFGELAELDVHSPEYRRLQHRIIEHCLPIADNIARRFASRGEPLEDLTQAARVGLVGAVQRFNPAKGSDFVSFAVPTITGAVRRHFRDNTWSVKVPRSLKDLSTQLTAAREELTQALGREPSAAELAVKLRVGVSDIHQALACRQAYHSAPLDPRASTSTPSSERIPGRMDLRLEQVDDWEVLRPLLIELPERERIVLLLRYFGLLPQAEIAEFIGVSQMHVSRLLNHTLEHLQTRLRGGIDSAA